MKSALAQLQWHYENRAAYAREQHRLGQPVIGITANTVPWELIRAAGATPVLLSPQGTTTLLADEFMEPVFDQAVRVTFDRVLAGEWSFLKMLVVPRTAEQQYKLFLYLREATRQGNTNIPPTHLYDLLHTRTPRSAAYGLARTRDLAAQLTSITGAVLSDTALAAAIQESNDARVAIRQLLRLRRRRKPKLSGAQAMTILGAWNFMNRAEYTALANQAANELRQQPALAGPAGRPGGRRERRLWFSPQAAGVRLIP